MKQTMGVADLAATFAPLTKAGQSGPIELEGFLRNLFDGALGAASGVLLLGPLGFVAGGVIGYAACPRLSFHPTLLLWLSPEFGCCGYNR